ncbi:hypothetical protein ISCGN_003387 [Ixodes scapularis]
MLLYEGYSYACSREDSETSYWIYKNRKGCTAKITMGKMISRITTRTGEHSHPRDTTTINLLKVRNTMKEKAERPQHQLLHGHVGRVTCLLYPHHVHSRYEIAHLVSGGVDFSVCLWDLYAGTLLHRFCVHAGEVSQLLVPPNNCSNRVLQSVCSVASDHSVALVGLKERKCVMLASRHLFPVAVVKWRPFDDFMVVGCSDGSVYVWQMETGHLDRVLQGLQAEEVLSACDEHTGHPGERMTNPAVHLFRGLRHRNMAAIRHAAQRGLHHLQHHPHHHQSSQHGMGHDVGDSAHARARTHPLMIQGLRTNPVDQDSHVLFFDIEALIGCLLILKVKQRTDASHAHTAMLSSRDMSELLAEFRERPQHQLLHGHVGRVTCLLYPHHVHSRYEIAHLVSGGVDFSVCLWDLYAGTLLHRFCVHAGEVSQLLVPPNNCSNRVLQSVCSVASDHSVALVGLKERKCVMLASRHLFPVAVVKWRPFDDFMVVGCSDGSVYVWQMETGHLDRVLQGLQAEEVLSACDEHTGHPGERMTNPAVHLFRGLRHRNMAAIRHAAQRGLHHLQHHPHHHQSSQHGMGHDVGDSAHARARTHPLMIQGLRTNPVDQDSHVLFFDIEALIGCLLILKVKQRTDASHAHTAMLSSRDMSELLAEFRASHWHTKHTKPH